MRGSIHWKEGLGELELRTERDWDIGFCYALIG
jgi:hypothetical protein